MGGTPPTPMVAAGLPSSPAVAAPRAILARDVEEPPEMLDSPRTAAIVPYLATRRAVEDAATLLAEHGDAAAWHAAARAERSRDLGNYIHFCHWRQIERLLAIMAASRAVGTVH